MRGDNVFSTRLCEIMEERGENQTTLAAKITEQYGIIQRQSIAQYMKGKCNPDTIRLSAICKALNVSADYLLGLSDYKTTDLDLRTVCEYLSLSESSVKGIMSALEDYMDRRSKR